MTYSEIFAGEKKSADLFTLDVVGDSSILKRFPKHSKTLKSEEIIAQRSAVPAVSMRKRPGDKTTDGILPVKRQRTTYITQKELTRLKNVADGQHQSTVEIVDADYDVWAAPAEEKNQLDEVYTFLPKAVKKKVPKTLKELPITLAANGKQVPAVAKPKGGHSYNPAFTDYQERLIEESDKAVATERKRIAELEEERLKLEASARSAAEAEAAEARADLSEWEEDSAWEGFESGGEELVKTKKPQRKTPAQRNRIKRRKEEERRVKHEARMKETAKQAERIKQIALEVAERERNLELAKVEFNDETEVGNDDELRRRRLGKCNLPEKDLELVLPDELQDSLRLLKPEGSLLKDRYRSMLVRGKMESRRKIPYRRQAKTKLTEKWTYKDFTF